MRIRIGQLTKRATDHPAKLLSTLVLAGATTACYDGQYFFSASHAEGDSGTQSNLVSYDSISTTAPTSDEFGEAVLAAIVKIMGFLDDRGEPMNQDAMAFDVMVPIPFVGIALKAVAALLGSGGASATLPALSKDFKVNVVPNPRLTWTTKFAVFRSDDVAKPFILQEEVPPTPMFLDETSEYAKVNGDCLAGVDWAGNVAFGFWQDAVQVTFI